MKISFQNINKAWFYFPCYLLILVGTSLGFYKFLNPPIDTNPIEIVEIGLEKSKVPQSFIDCYDEYKQYVGGVFKLIPSAELMESFEQLDQSCYNSICNELNAIYNGELTLSEFYDLSRDRDNCLYPVLQSCLIYHHQQVKELDLFPIFYNSGDWELNRRQKHELDIFLKSFSKNAKEHGMLIIARASKAGNSNDNKELSKFRADEIIEFVNKRTNDDLYSEHIYFGAEPPVLNQNLARDYKIEKSRYKNVLFGVGEDSNYSLRLNQSVLLVKFNKSEDPFDLIK